MPPEIVVALIAFCGTLVGSLVGVLTANKLVNYRIAKLEEKVDKHNSLIERTYRLEGEVSELQHDVRDIKNKI